VTVPCIAHLSDLHLLSLRGLRVRDLLGKRITGAANLLLNRGGQYPERVARAAVQDINRLSPDHVVVSGDVTNLSLEAEFELVGQLLSELDLPRSRLTLVPGNHDCYTRKSQRDRTFQRVLAPYLHGDVQPGPGPFPSLKLQDELAVLALSSSVASAPLMAVGTLGSRQLQLAEELLRHPECEGRFRLVVVHHPPAGPHVRWHNGLTDADGLLQVLARTGAELVVCGHVHRFSRQQVPGPEGPIPLISVGSGTWLSPKDPDRRAQYNVYHTRGRTLERVATRRWEPGRQAHEDFAPASLQPARAR
jgi:3',5'-cyclic AMP phosphodiesterase CpdA